MWETHACIDVAQWCDDQQVAADVRGWAFRVDDQPIAAVRALAGGRVWQGRHGDPREDVSAGFPGSDTAGTSGFSVRLEVAGAETAQLEFQDEAGEWRPLLTLDPGTFAPPPPPLRYSYRGPDLERSRQLHALGAGLGCRPLISVIVPTYDTPPALLRACLDSVRNQLYENWELCIADDASPRAETRRVLAGYASADSRIKTVFLAENGNISAATNAALALATGEYVAFLDHDDELTPDALLEVAAHLDAHPGADLIYSDHDKLDPNGRCVDPHFKPDWSPEFFRAVMYLCHLVVVRRELMKKIGGFDSAYDGIQDYEAELRLSEHAARIDHLPKVLYHWRIVPGSFAAATDAKTDREHLQAKAVNAQLARLGSPASAETFSGGHRVRVVPHPRVSWPKVSVVIPTRDAPDYLERCLESIGRVTTYENYEILLGDNDTTDPRALEVMERRPCRRVACPGAFNFSRVNNRCVAEAAGEYVILLNNDTEIITPDWIEQMLYYAEQPGVGAVGPLLLFPDGRVQHAGVILGPRGTADHVMRLFPGEADGYYGSLVAAREVSVLTAACLMVSRELYEGLGGLNEHYFTIYQDTDFCLELRQMGLRNIFTPNARLFHHESVSRKAYYDWVDRFLLLDRWAPWIDAGDPYHNPNFDPAHDDYRLRGDLQRL